MSDRPAVCHCGDISRLDPDLWTPTKTFLTPEKQAEEEQKREERESVDSLLERSNLIRLTPETAHKIIKTVDAVAVIGHVELRGTATAVDADGQKVTVDFLRDLLDDSDESRSRTEAAHAKWPGTSFGRWAQGGDNGRKVVVPCDELAVVREFVNGE